MKVSTRTGRIVASFAVAGVVVLGGATAAVASTVHTSFTNVYAGFVGPYRNATAASQTFDFLGVCYYGVAGTATPTYAQIQLQKYNGVFPPTSLGNKNVGCGGSDGAQNWGTVEYGQSYRYQFNGAKLPTSSGLGSGPFSDNDILLSY